MPFKANKLPGKWVWKVVQGRIKCVNCCGNYPANWSGCARAKGEERHKTENWKIDLNWFLQNYKTIFEMLTRSAVAISCNKFFRCTQSSVNLSKIVTDCDWNMLTYPFFVDGFKNIYPIHIDWIEPGEHSDSLVGFIPEKNVKFTLIK